MITESKGNYNMKTLEQIREELETRKDRSAWNKGVTTYALELIEEAIENNIDTSNKNLLVKGLLNGASDWDEYSEGGCSLIYDYDIACRLCTPSELRRTDDARLRPNSRESWIDCQTRALRQACIRIVHSYNRK